MDLLPITPICFTASLSSAPCEKTSRSRSNMSDAVPMLPNRSELGGRITVVRFSSAGVFPGTTVWTDAAGNELVRCWRSDGLGPAKLRALAIPAWVLSTETHPVVTKRCAKLGVPCRQGLANKQAELE